MTYRRFLGLAVAVCAVSAAGQDAKPPESTDRSQRTVIQRVQPQYPELARRLNIQGRVKLQVVVSPSGKVKSTRALGGNPVLVQAATEAVEKWKYRPAAGESISVVELDFQHP